MAPKGNGSRNGRAERSQRASVGLRDVARVAGVSTATVSRAINNPELVSREVRQRVAAVVDQLGWVPDGAARALTTRRSGAIGAVFPTLTHGDFARATAAIQAELHSRGYTLLLACSNYDPDQEYQQVRKFVERGVDGIILVGENHHPELLTLLQRRRVPFVNTFVYTPETHGTCIGPDNRKALYNLTRYLADLGHRRFGVVAQSTRNNDRAAARLEGIRDALAELGLAVSPQHLAIGEWTIAEGRALFRKVMSAAPAPTAVLCGNAYLAVGAILESMAMGLAVPGEVSIVGYDDIELMSELPVPVTTVKVNSDGIGRDAARFVISKIERKPESIIFEWGAEILVRASSGPPPERRRGSKDSARAAK
jgi:LacI family transcriptional regulator